MQTQVHTYSPIKRTIIDDNKEFKMIESRLQYWGRSYMNDLDDQSHPKQSAFLNRPMDAFSGPKKRELKDNPDAEEINIIVIELHHRHREWEAVIRQEYTVKNRSQDYKAQILGMSRARYLSLLKLAKVWIEARLP